jgi:hypothetical protein
MVVSAITVIMVPTSSSRLASPVVVVVAEAGHVDLKLAASRAAIRVTPLVCLTEVRSATPQELSERQRKTPDNLIEAPGVCDC